MKKILLITTGLVFVFLACNNPSVKSEPAAMQPAKSEEIKKESTPQSFTFDTSTLKSGQNYYQCPMDLQVISDKEGLCPVCGMDLEITTKK